MFDYGSYNSSSYPYGGAGGMTPMSTGPGPQLTPQGFWDIVKVVAPVLISMLSTTPGGMAPQSAGFGIAPQSAGFGIAPQSAGFGIAPQSATPAAQLTPQGWGWVLDIVKVVAPVILNQLSTTPGGISPQMTTPGGQLTPQGWGWVLDIVKTVVPVILNQLSTTPGGMTPMSTGGGPMPMGSFAFGLPTVPTPWGPGGGGGISIGW